MYSLEQIERLITEFQKLGYEKHQIEKILLKIDWIDGSDFRFESEEKHD